MRSFIVLMSSVGIYNIESDRNKEKPLNWEDVSKHLTGTVCALQNQDIAYIGELIECTMDVCW